MRIPPGLRIRPLAASEVDTLWSIDRSETIRGLYRAGEAGLELRAVRIEVRGWPPGERERYGPRLRSCVGRGGAAWGAFEQERPVAGAVLEARPVASRPHALQLLFLHVGRGHRGRGLGRALLLRAADRARALGAESLYVSATPSENTVRFYRGLGFEPATPPDPELLALEPEDIHLELALRRPDSGSRRSAGPPLA